MLTGYQNFTTRFSGNWWKSNIWSHVKHIAATTLWNITVWKSAEYWNMHCD